MVGRHKTAILLLQGATSTHISAGWEGTIPKLGGLPVQTKGGSGLGFLLLLATQKALNFSVPAGRHQVPALLCLDVGSVLPQAGKSLCVCQGLGPAAKLILAGTLPRVCIAVTCFVSSSKLGMKNYTITSPDNWSTTLPTHASFSDFMFIPVFPPQRDIWNGLCMISQLSHPVHWDLRSSAIYSQEPGLNLKVSSMETIFLNILSALDEADSRILWAIQPKDWVLTKAQHACKAICLKNCGSGFISQTTRVQVITPNVEKLLGYQPPCMHGFYSLALAGNCRSDPRHKPSNTQSTHCSFTLYQLILFVCFVLRQNLMQHQFVLKALHVWGWPWASYPPASVSRVLEFYAFATTPSFIWWCDLTQELHSCQASSFPA